MDELERKLRAAAPDIFLAPNFTYIVMQKTVYSKTRKQIGGYSFHQLRMAGVSMILAGCLIMAGNTAPVTQNLHSLKSIWDTSINQVSPIIKHSDWLSETSNSMQKRR